MSDDGGPEREARRALLADALAELADAPDRERAAADVMRALDAYIAAERPLPTSPRESPVTDFTTRGVTRETRRATWLVVGGAALATAIVAVGLSGGWPAAIAVVVIWLVALVALTQTS